MAKVLVIDDEQNLRHTLSYALQQEGHEVATAVDGEEGIETFRSMRPDLVILDVMLPRIDGFEVCRRLRREGDVPIIMLTARDSEFDKVVGLELGADDYLVKPFSVRELVARVRAMLRRARPPAPAPSADELRAPGLTLDIRRHRVLRDGDEVALKPREFDLLAFLMAHPGQALTREQILTGVWGYDYSGDARTVDTHVKALRERLGDRADAPRWIETVRGVGYRFREEAAARAPSAS
jgi:DNA-binding response OmpR family regulator